MKILAIGDPHGSLEKVKKIPLKGIDLILLTGDLGSANLMRKMAFDNVERKRKGLEEKEHSTVQRKRAFMEAYSSSMKVVRYLSKNVPVFTIYGNVESRNYETRKTAKEIGVKLPFLTDDLNKIKGVSVINNKIRNFSGVRIGGLDYFIDDCWVRSFVSRSDKDYSKKLRSAKRDSMKARNVLKWFDGLDILVCHQPPYGYLDKVTAKFAPKRWKGKNAGSKVIVDYVKRKQPKYVFCGHIHEGEGYRKIGKSNVYNLGVCGYRIVEF
jgi:Icc-related predicted phosphoesterase